jgi:pimeloyl-ACP methyl ester carboxylesterase
MSATIPLRTTLRYADLVADVSGGDDSRPPIVLLHGLTFDRRTWWPVLDELERIDPDRRVVAFDLPGHGDSPAATCYDLEVVVEAVHRAVTAAGLERPVIAGHSMSAVLATIYAAYHPTSAVVTVDATLRVGPFGEFVRSLEPELRGPRFPAVWEGVFEPSMHAELLDPDAQAIVRRSSRPRQELVLGYQRELLELPAGELEGRAHVVLAVLRAARLPYSLIAGDGVTEQDRRWLTERMPHAAIEVWPGTGHFPQLGDPRRFARHLAETPRNVPAG